MDPYKRQGTTTDSTTVLIDGDPTQLPAITVLERAGIVVDFIDDDTLDHLRAGNEESDRAAADAHDDTDQ